MIWHKEAGMKYTTMCIFIDANIEKLRNPGEYPEIEEKIYNYLWLLIKALAIKKGMFPKFEDYDGYAFYGANRIFFALRKNLQNQGHIVKGKEIRPIKSCLNYTKALLYPMKIEYQNETYREILDNELVSKQFDLFSFQQKMLTQTKNSQDNKAIFLDYLQESFDNCGELLDNVLQNCPFKKNSIEYKKLKLTVLLNCLNGLKEKQALLDPPSNPILWHLPKSLSGYVRLLIKEFYSEIKREIIDCYASSDIDDETALSIMYYRDGEISNERD